MRLDGSALLARVRSAAPAFSQFGRASKPSALIHIALPTRADAPASIGLDVSRALTVRAVDVASVAAQSVEGASLFVAARPSMDLLLASGGDRFEEIRVLHDARAPRVARWKLEPRDGLVDVRLRGATPGTIVEALDDAGHVIVRTDPMFAVDARGVRREPALALTREGRTWSLSATLDDAGLTYPIVLDPIWLYGAATSASHTPASTVRLSDGKVYVAGGGSVLEVFDPKTASFTKLADAPTSFYNVWAMFATSSEQIRLLADKVYTYDPKTNTWTSGAAWSPRDVPAVVQLADGKVFVAGGGNVSNALSTVEVYDPVADTWASKASLSTKRAQAMGAVLPSGKVLIAGGEDGGVTLATTELYDPSTNTWSDGPGMSTPMHNASVIPFGSGSAVFLGGLNGFTPTTKSAIYDPATNTFASGPTLGLGRANPAIVLAGSRVFVIGGALGSESTTGSVEVSPPLLGAFANTLGLLIPRERAGAAALLDGRVLVVGGSGGMSTGGGPTTISELLSSYLPGEKCSFNPECASGFCVSGVCCSSACTGACERCNNAGSVGTCAPAAAKTECGAAASCTGSSLTPPAQCDGAATTCPAATPIACPGALTCADAVSCRTSCKKNEDCATGNCDVSSGLCLAADAGVGDAGDTDAGADSAPVEDDAATAAPVPEGAPKVVGSAQRCTLGSECSTGFCVDGVCCDSACKDRCHSCALPSAPGRCTESPLGVDLRAECGPALSCSGTCGKGGVCTNNATGSQCSPSVCTGATTGKGAAYCKGRGVTCTPEEAVAFDCGEYICDPAFGACRTSCTSSEGCAPGYLCNLDAKRCEALASEDDSGCAVSQVGRPGQVLASLMSVALGLGLLRRRRTR